jgi:hypothetical protein
MDACKVSVFEQVLLWMALRHGAVVNQWNVLVRSEANHACIVSMSNQGSQGTGAAPWARHGCM